MYFGGECANKQEVVSDFQINLYTECMKTHKRYISLSCQTKKKKSFSTKDVEEIPFRLKCMCEESFEVSYFSLDFHLVSVQIFAY